MSDAPHTGITRRAFLGLGAALAGQGLLPAPARAAAPVSRTLGRTGLKVTEVGMGVMITSNPDIVRAAVDAGITYFDTARAYMGGRNEVILAEGLGARRKEVVVATKCHHLGSVRSVLNSCEASLRALNTDVIDVFQLHNLSDPRQVLLPEHLEAVETLRRAGKIRFAGVTTHGNMVAILDAAVEAKIYDTVLTTYNFREPEGLGAAIERTAAAGVGVVAMKIMAGGYADAGFPGLNPFQSALRWVLGKKAVATTIPSLATFEQLQENVAVMGTSYGALDDLSLRFYAAAIGGRHCRVCGGCAGTCPRGADVPALMRALMYAEGYGRPELAAETFAAVGFPCGDCADCTAACRSGLDLPARLAAARRLHTVVCA